MAYFIKRKDIFLPLFKLVGTFQVSWNFLTREGALMLRSDVIRAGDDETVQKFEPLRHNRELGSMNGVHKSNSITIEDIKI
jgi:hypothetical protein